MATLIPEDKRLQATAFVKNAELEAIGRGQIIRHAAEEMAEMALRKILDGCITTKGNYMGYQGQTLKLDVYVLSPQELHKIIVKARQEGEQDARRWMS